VRPLNLSWRKDLSLCKVFVRPHKEEHEFSADFSADLDGVNRGGNMSVSAGPLGRNLEGTGTLSAKGGVSAMYSYSRSKGLFGGASIEGSIIVERSDANSKAYNQNVTAKQLLSGAVDMPGWAFELGDTIKRRSGKDNRIPGWIEDGEDVDRGRGDREYDSDEDGEEREVRKSDGLTPREYGERGYSFGSQYAQGGSHLSKGDSYSGSTSKERSSSPSTTGRERSGSTGGKFSGMLGSIGRSRSGSGASAIGMSKKDSNNGGMSSGDRGERNASSRQGGPISGEDYNFGTKFESTYESEQAQKYTSSTSSPLRSPPLTKKDFSLIDAEDPFSEGNSLPIMSTDPPPAATKRPGMFSRNSSSKLTKSRSGSGNGNALRERVGQMNWDTFGGTQNRDQDEDPSRASFDSLDDERTTNDDHYTRKRASTLQGTSNSSDVLSFYQRPPLSSSKSGSGRTRSFTSPFGGGGGSSSPSLFSKKKKPEQTAYNDPMREMRERNGGGGGGGSELYPIRSNDSFGQLNSDSEFNDPDYTERKDGGGGRQRGDSNPQASWRDTTAEDREASARPSQSRSNSARGDAFDFKQVGRDFDESTTNGGNRSRSGTVTSSGGGGGRSRSGTVTGATSTKGGIGTATAKYDFRGVEVRLLNVLSSI